VDGNNSSCVDEADKLDTVTTECEGDMLDLINSLRNGSVYIKDRSSSVLITKLKHINEMIGLKKLKTFVTDVFYYHAARIPCDSMFPNICLTGVPGSGKTEVCL